MLIIDPHDQFGNDHPNFKKMVVVELDKLAETPLGAQLWRDAYNGPRMITIRPSAAHIRGGASTERVPYGWAVRAIRWFWGMGDGAHDALIEIDENVGDDDVTVSGRDGKFIPIPRWLILGHELIHAIHVTDGTWVATNSRNPNFVTRFSKEEERTILTGHPSENDLRRERKMPLRYGDGGDDRRN